MSQTASTQDQPAAQPTHLSPDYEELLEPELLDLLRREEHIVRPFAWGGPREKGLVAGIDQQGKLKTVRFRKTKQGYAVDRIEEEPNKEVRRVEESGSLFLGDLLSEREFPFRSDIVIVGRCRVHFVLVLRAVERSLVRDLYRLTEVNLRIITETDSGIVSSGPERFGFFSLQEASTIDLNSDGRCDYLVIGQDNYKHLYAWTVTDNCAAESMLFEIGDKTQSLSSISARDLFVRTNQDGRALTVHTVESELMRKKENDFWQITETVYKWDKQKSVFKELKQFVSLKSVR